MNNASGIAGDGLTSSDELDDEDDEDDEEDEEEDILSTDMIGKCV